jgi:hypothetical protein
MSVQASPIGLHDWSELAARIRKLDPTVAIPPATPAGYRAAHELWMKLSAEPYIKPNVDQQKWIDAGTRQTAIAGKIADFIRRGLVREDDPDFQFLSEEEPASKRLARIAAIDGRLDAVWSEQNWSSDHRARVALHEARDLRKENAEIKAALKEAIGRLHDLEQELWLRNDAA